MVKNKKKLVIISATIFLSMSLSIGITNADFSNIFQKYSVNDEVQLMDTIGKLSVEELISEIDLIAKDLDESQQKANINTPSSIADINALIPFVSELFARQDQINDEEILGLVSDNTKSAVTRESLIDLYAVKHEAMNNGTEINKLLLQDEINSQIKSKIVSVANFSSQDIGLLIELIDQDDELLSFNSLKRLSSVDVAKGYEISQKILANRENEGDNKVSAALRATAKYLNTINKTTIHKNESKMESDFVNLSLEIIKTSGNPTLKDSATFAISEIGSVYALTKIIESDLVDQELKVFAIDQNFLVLKELLGIKASEGEITTVVSAMEILPILDLVDPLNDSLPGIKDLDLVKRAEKVIEFAKQEGVKGNYKWSK